MKFCPAADDCAPKTMDIYAFHPTGFLLMEISKLGVHFVIIFLFYPLLTLKPFALPWAPHESVFSSTSLILLSQVLGEIPQNWACPVDTDNFSAD